MKMGTRSVLFGVHHFFLHPMFVLWAWLLVYRELPRMHELAAIVTHDLGYWGASNIDGGEGEGHPERMSTWWRAYFGRFGERVALEILGHSRHYAAKHSLPLSRLYRPDKLSLALYPKWLYLFLANLSGEIEEYMDHCRVGKYSAFGMSTQSQSQWFADTRAHMLQVGYGVEKAG